MYTNLSVNINKIATLRNARGGDIPHLLTFAKNCELFGADGITVHPRPDERHIRYADVRELKKILQKELNIEGNPTEQKFIDLVLEVKPNQVTLVPDEAGAITSQSGWDCIQHQTYLRETIEIFHAANIRTSIFINPDPLQVVAAAQTRTHRIELYTAPYAENYEHGDAQNAILPYIQSVQKAVELGLEINAGHDLNSHNLAFFKKNLPLLHEVSIGHALISEALYLGIQNTIQLYKKQLQHFAVSCWTY